MSKLRVNEITDLNDNLLWNVAEGVGGAAVSTASGDQTLNEALQSRVIYVDTIADLQALDTSELVDGQVVDVVTTERAGRFVIKSGTAPVPDPLEGVYVTLDSSNYAERKAEWLKPQFFGAMADGVTADDAAIRSCLEFPHDKFEFDGHYRADLSEGNVVGFVSSDSHVRFTPGSKIELLPHSLQSYNILRIDNSGDIILEDIWVDGRRDINSETSGEHGHGLSVVGGTGKINIINPRTDNCWGDGIYIGAGAVPYTNDIYVKNHHAKNNRRQGMSIVSVRRCVVDDPVWEETNGTSPQTGCDIEPNGNDARLDFIRINRPVTRNNFSHGILIYLATFIGPVAKTVDIKITDHHDEGSSTGMSCVSGDTTGSILNGRILSADPVWKLNKTVGYEGKWDGNSIPVEIERPTVVNSNQVGSGTPRYASAFSLVKETGAYPLGGLRVTNPSIQGGPDNESVIYASDLGSAETPKSIEIIDPTRISGGFQTPGSFGFIGTLSDEHRVWTRSYSGSATVSTTYNSPTVYGRGILTIDGNGRSGGPSITFINDGAGSLSVNPPVGGNFLGEAADAGYQCPADGGSTMKVTPITPTVWRIDYLSGDWTVV